MYQSWKSRAAACAIAAAIVVPALALASPSGAADANAVAKAACKGFGWQHYVDIDNAPFKNQGDCASYATRGGQLGTACFDSTNPVMSFDFRLTTPVDTSANTTLFWSSDGTCSGGVLVKDTTVAASDHAQAVSKCATVTGASGDNAYLWQAAGYTTAPANWWGCGVLV